MRVGSWMISFKEIVWHDYLYLDTEGEFKFLKSSDCFSLKTNLSFSRKVILKSPRK